MTFEAFLWALLSPFVIGGLILLVVAVIATFVFAREMGP
jgi:hypothetical protein